MIPAENGEEVSPVDMHCYRPLDRVSLMGCHI